VARSLPELSRFELECLRRLWARGEASVREVYEDLSDPPTYSTVRKIFERLEAKGAIERLRRIDRAWIYRSTVAPQAMIRKEILRLLEGLFGGRGGPLVAHLADMDALSLEDLRAVESRLAIRSGDRAARRPRGRSGRRRSS